MCITDSLSTHRFCTFLSFDIHFLEQGMLPKNHRDICPHHHHLSFFDHDICSFIYKKAWEDWPAPLCLWIANIPPCRAEAAGAESVERTQLNALAGGTLIWGTVTITGLSTDMTPGGLCNPNIQSSSGHSGSSSSLTKKKKFCFLVDFLLFACNGGREKGQEEKNYSLAAFFLHTHHCLPKKGHLREATSWSRLPCIRSHSRSNTSLPVIYILSSCFALWCSPSFSRTVNSPATPSRSSYRYTFTMFAHSRIRRLCPALPVPFPILCRSHCTNDGHIFPSCEL